MSTAESNNPLDSYTTDTSAEQDGQWVEFRGGMEVKVRSDQSDKVRDYTNKLMKKQRQAYIANGGLLPPKMQDTNDLLLCVHAIVADWRNVVGDDKKPLPCTSENLTNVLKKYPRFRQDIITASRTEETFRQDMVEAMSGNSASTSPTS